MAHMRSPSSESTANTRERLLDAAAQLFAENGREGVSIRDIAARAGVRHGCINYHFRSKDELYREALLANCCPQGREELLSSIDQAPRPEEARKMLAGIVRKIVHAEVQPLDPVAAGFVRAEIARPEGPDQSLFEGVIQPNQRALAKLIGHAFPEISDEKELVIAALNLASQCIFLRLARPVALKLLGVEEFDGELTERIADRIIQTALGGLSAGEEVLP